MGDLVWVEVMLRPRVPPWAWLWWMLFRVVSQSEPKACGDLPSGRRAVDRVESDTTGPSVPSSLTTGLFFLPRQALLPGFFGMPFPAVSGGQFLAPPIQASCMYDEARHSLGESAVVRVSVRLTNRGRWVALSSLCFVRSSRRAWRRALLCRGTWRRIPFRWNGSRTLPGARFFPTGRAVARTLVDR